MASVALMIGGAVLNATAIIGGSYLANMLGGKDADEERKRHDLALKKYQRDYQRYVENKEKLESWLDQRMRNEDKTAYKFKSTDEALKYYNRMHLGGGDPEIMRLLTNQGFRNIIRQANNKRTEKCSMSEVGCLLLGLVSANYFKKRSWLT